MSNSTLRDTLFQLAEPAVRAQGLAIWGLEIVEGRQMIVRLFVEAAPGSVAPDSTGAAEDDERLLSATVDQCEAISRQFSLALDVEDAIERAYVLEVSTPGFNRLFFSCVQMRPYIGDMVDARLPAPWSPGEELPARRTWKGLLRAVGDDNFTIQPATADADGCVIPENLPEVTIPMDRCRRVNRLHIFTRPQKPGKKPPAENRSPRRA